MENKTLIGVMHKNRNEFDKLINLVDRFYPRSVGLELPEKYEERVLNIGSNGFSFTNLADYFKSNNVRVVPLEKFDEWEYRSAVNLAKEIREKNLPIGLLEKELGDFETLLKSGYTAPELIKLAEQRIPIYRLTLEISYQHQELDGIISIWEKTNEVCDVQMLKIVIEEDLDMCIVGTGHALKLKPYLLNYEFYEIKI